jgi:hypothetical protein
MDTNWLVRVSSGHGHSDSVQPVFARGVVTMKPWENLYGDADL